MYQGKFDAKTRGHQSPEENLQNILEAREAARVQAAAKAKAQAAAKAQAQARAKAAAAAKAQPAAEAPAPAAKPAANANAQAAARAQALARAQAAKAAQNAQQGAAPTVKAAPAAKPAVQNAPAAKPAKNAAKKKGSPVGTAIFYTLYCLYIFAFFVGVFFVLQWLNGWLHDYEAAQPTVKSEQVFDEYFRDPDWAKLYQLAKADNSEYEGVEQFVEFMKDKIGNRKLDYVETSAGLSNDKKFIVRAEGEKIATFTLEGKNEVTKVTDIPDWQLGKIELYFTRQQGYLIQKVDGHTAFVNGVALDDSFTIARVSIKAEELPLGTSGAQTCTQKISGLLMMPEVTIYNQSGEQMPVEYDDATGTFVEQTQETVISEAERDAAAGAMKAYAGFMINASGARAEVSKYYDGSSSVYSDIIKMASELWMNHDYGHRFGEVELTNYTRFSEDGFAVRGSLNMNVTLKDGNTRDYPIEMSMFFHLKNGKWVCYNFTNADVLTPVGEVRLTFMDANRHELSSQFYETDCTSLIAPVVAVPDGQVFSGWVREDVDAMGRTVLTVVFLPDESGNVTISSGTVLTPMTLYPLFENA